MCQILMVMVSYNYKKCLINVLIVFIRLNIQLYIFNYYKFQLVLWFELLGELIQNDINYYCVNYICCSVL